MRLERASKKRIRKSASGRSCFDIPEVSKSGADANGALDKIDEVLENTKGLEGEINQNSRRKKEAAKRKETNDILQQRGLTTGRICGC